MELLIITLLILVGIVLLMLEILVIPGIAIAGISGGLLMIGGVVYAYQSLGATAGHITLMLTLILFVSAFVLAFRSKTWKKAGLDAEIDGIVNENETLGIQVGDTGKTISRLAPMGKIKVNNKVIEAKSLDGYIDPHIDIEIVKVLNTNVIVKLIKI